MPVILRFAHLLYMASNLDLKSFGDPLLCINLSLCVLFPCQLGVYITQSGSSRH